MYYKLCINVATSAALNQNNILEHERGKEDEKFYLIQRNILKTLILYKKKVWAIKIWNSIFGNILK